MRAQDGHRHHNDAFNILLYNLSPTFKEKYICVKIDRVLGVTNTEFFFTYNSEIKQRYVRAHLLNAL